MVDVRLAQASGTAEREAAEAMISGKPKSRSVMLAGGRGYDVSSFVARLRALNVTPHLAQNDSHRRSAIDGRTTRHIGYAVSQRKRKRVEEVFGWIKAVALQRKTRFRGLERVGWMFTLAASAYNLVRTQPPANHCIGMSVSACGGNALPDTRHPSCIIESCLSTSQQDTDYVLSA